MRLIRDEMFDLGDRHEDGHMDLPRMIEGGLDAQIFACWPSPDQSDKEIMQVTLGLLRNYHRLGVRCMTLTWNNTNNWADSSTDTMKWGGLNELGRDVVREMGRLGMIIDCSHVSDSTFFDVIEVTKNPVLVSHSCVRSIADVPRNVSDDQLRALGENGGVLCVNYFTGFLDKEYFDRVSVLCDKARSKVEKLAAEYGGNREKAWREVWHAMQNRAAEIPLPELSLLVDHIDCAVRIAGVDHVGLGSDFDGISQTPVGLENVSKLPAITAELAGRGYSHEDIEKILGLNLLRLVEQVCRQENDRSARNVPCRRV